MAIKKWTVGDVPKLKVIFKDAETLLPMAPSVVTLMVKRPGVAAVVYTFGTSDITNPTLGTYIYALPLTVKGTYKWRWTGANGPNEGAAEEGTLDAVTNI